MFKYLTTLDTRRYLLVFVACDVIIGRLCDVTAVMITWHRWDSWLVRWDKCVTCAVASTTISQQHNSCNSLSAWSQHCVELDVKLYYTIPWTLCTSEDHYAPAPGIGGSGGGRSAKWYARTEVPRPKRRMRQGGGYGQGCLLLIRLGGLMERRKPSPQRGAGRSAAGKQILVPYFALSYHPG